MSSSVRSPSFPPLAAVATLAAMVSACSSPSEPPPAEEGWSSSRISTLPRTPVCSDSVAPPPDVGSGARGMWAWGTKTRLDDADGTAVLVESARKAGLNELYLSVNDGVLEDPRLPRLMETLGHAGLRVEALMGEATWYEPGQRSAMLAHIDEVAAFNEQHAPGFAAVHLDVEPHQLPQNQGDHAFLPLLADALGEAAAHARHFCMSTSADLPRFALDEAGPSFAQAVPRVFVMLYQLRSKSSGWLTLASDSVLDQTYAGLGAQQRGRLVVSLRVEDYVDTLGTMVSTLDDAHGDSSRYGGWAIHDEAHFRALMR